MTEKRGRPKLNKNTFDVNSLLCEYLTTKVDKYDNEISYYKIVDDTFKIKMKNILKEQCDGCLMPFWKTDDQEIILKVKTKNIIPDKDLKNNDITTLNMTFKYYCMQKDDKLLQGYFIKIIKISSYEDDKENNN